MRAKITNYNDGTKHTLTGDSLQSIADQYVALKATGFELATEKIYEDSGKLVGWVYPTPFGTECWSYA